ncbi:integrase catalytic domain-containing protein [Trichonephila clavipes]|nr:integrase catalytic domain-containing protein [Trichonephila clavipes]
MVTAAYFESRSRRWIDHFKQGRNFLCDDERLGSPSTSTAEDNVEVVESIVMKDAVTDLTTEAFIAALKRLCARRGRISTLMSDNTTNFKGAAAELNRFIKLIRNKNETLSNYFASEAIQWKFILPRSPNFGGLWEAGTIIIQIEGILNSRPLVPLSDNINEYEVLTPGHFIIGRPISAIPEPAILDISDNRLSRWQYTRKCVQTIWKRWKNDYLNYLQQRNKWQFEKNNVAVGCLVLLKENDFLPANGQWQESWRLFMELTVRSASLN